MQVSPRGSGLQDVPRRFDGQQWCEARTFSILKILSALAVTLCWLSPAVAQTVDVRAGHVIDPSAAKVLDNQRIRIIDGKISTIIPWRDEDGAATIDWSAYTVLPGLIDLHTHLSD